MSENEVKNVQSTEQNEAQNVHYEKQTQPENELILGRFKSYDDLAKSYQELEKTHYQKLNEFQNIKKEYEALKNPKIPLTELVQQKLEENNGILDYDEFKKAGYDPEVVDIVKGNIEAQKALEETRKAQKLLEAEKILGENKNEIVQFSNDLFNSDTFADEEKALIAQLNEENPTLLAKISTFLYEGYKANSDKGLFNPYTSRLQNSTDLYKSEKEFQADMRRPEFKNDKAFRERILAKASRSFNN